MGREIQEKRPPATDGPSSTGIATPAFLAAVLVLLSLLCLFAVLRGLTLRQESKLHLAHTDALHRLRGALEAMAPDQVRVPQKAIEAQRRVGQKIEERAKRSEDNASLLALRNLNLATEALEQASGADARWGAALGLLAAADRAAEPSQRRLGELHGQLGRTWAALAVLAVAALGLAAATLRLARGSLRLAELRQAQVKEALEGASRDRLTGLWNRDNILRVFATELERSRRQGTPLGLILLDLDRFPEIQEWVGGAQAEEILEGVSGRLANLVRPYDTLGRYGAYTFLTVLPSCDGTATAAVAERLLAAVRDEEHQHSLGKTRVDATLAHKTLSFRTPEDASGLVASDLVAALSRAIEGTRENGQGPLVQLD